MNDTSRELLNRLRQQHRQAPEVLDQALPELGLTPLSGGRNNRVYAWDSPEGRVCLKLYRTDGELDRDRAAVEWQALTHLADHGIRGVPLPLWHDLHPHLPAVVMTMVPGKTVLDAADRAGALRAMAPILQALRGIPLGPFADLPRVDSIEHYVHRIAKVWAPRLREETDDPLTGDLIKLLDDWEGTNDAWVLQQPAKRIWSRGDSNLLNWHLDELTRTVGVVDFEFVGYSDTCVDAADLIEHLSARDISDETWAGLLPMLGVDDEPSRRRFRAAQRTTALRWLAVLWKQRARRVEEFDTQLTRVRALQSRHLDLIGTSGSKQRRPGSFLYPLCAERLATRIPEPCRHGTGERTIPRMRCRSGLLSGSVLRRLGWGYPPERVIVHPP